MKAQKKQGSNGEIELFRSKLENLIDHNHDLVSLCEKIDWKKFDDELGLMFSLDNGRPALSTRLMVGLQYLKYLYNESDENVVARFVENPYWQYFCGNEYFEHRLPCDPSSLVRWRKRIGTKGAEKLLKETIEIARRSGKLTDKELSEVNIDTTVQCKNITYPTDAKLLNSARKHLVKQAKEDGIDLRQSYKRLGDKAFMAYVRTNHRKDKRSARKYLRKLRTFLGRVIRDIRRKCPNPSDSLAYILAISGKIWKQKKGSKNRIYSVHAPETTCIAKGKAHKKYEFGSKVSIVSTCKSNWIVGVNSFPSNPFDGHTIPDVLCQIKLLTGDYPKAAYCDRGYKGSEGLVYSTNVYQQGQKNLSKPLREKLRKRAAIEPVIGHLKSDHRMGRNFLAGIAGDQINALMAGCAFNLKKLLRELYFAIFAMFYSIFQNHSNTGQGPEFVH